MVSTHSFWLVSLHWLLETFTMDSFTEKRLVPSGSESKSLSLNKFPGNNQQPLSGPVNLVNEYRAMMAK